VVIIKNTILQDMMPYGLVSIYIKPGGSYYLHHPTCKFGAVLAKFYKEI